MCYAVEVDYLVTLLKHLEDLSILAFHSVKDKLTQQS